MSRRFRLSIWGWLGVAMLGMFFSFCVFGGIPGLDVVITLLMGWVLYLHRVVPDIQVRWGMVISGVVYAALVLFGSHFFLRWLHREMSKPGGARRWPFAWTLRGFCLVILMFVSGIAFVGVVHQTAWLASSPVPIWRPGGDAIANRVKCASNLRLIGQAILLYANESHGQYPDDFSALLRIEDITPAVFVCPSSNDNAAEGKTDAEIVADFQRPATVPTSISARV